MGAGTAVYPRKICLSGKKGQSETMVVPGEEGLFTTPDSVISSN